MAGLNVTHKGLNGMFRVASAEFDMDWVERIITRRTSNQDTETYRGVGSHPQMTPFTGMHQYAALAEDALSAKNAKYVNGIQIAKQDLMEDKTMTIMEAVRGLAGEVVYHKRELALNVGIANTLLGYDGKALYANDHSTRLSGSQDNLLAPVWAASPGTAAEWAKAIIGPHAQAAIPNILSFKDDNGRPGVMRGARSFIVAVALADMGVAMEAVELAFAAGGATNLIPNQRRFDIRVEPDPMLTTSGTFYTYAVDHPHKAVLLQERGSIESHYNGPGSDAWNYRKVAEYGIEYDGVAMPWYWQSTTKSVFTT